MCKWKKLKSWNWILNAARESGSEYVKLGHSTLREKEKN